MPPWPRVGVSRDAVSAGSRPLTMLVSRPRSGVGTCMTWKVRAVRTPMQAHQVLVVSMKGRWPRSPSAASLPWRWLVDHNVDTAQLGDRLATAASTCDRSRTSQVTRTPTHRVPAPHQPPVALDRLQLRDRILPFEPAQRNAQADACRAGDDRHLASSRPMRSLNRSIRAVNHAHSHTKKSDGTL